MDKAKTMMPAEIVAIVQNTELNRSGWWDKTIQRLILGVAWLAGKPVTVSDIQQNIKSAVQLNLSLTKISSAIKDLEKQDALVSLDSSLYRIPDSYRPKLEKDIAKARDANLGTQRLFAKMLFEECKDLDPDHTWKIFESDFLIPFIKETGANTYRLIAGEQLDIDQKRIQKFLSRFNPKHQAALGKLIPLFLDPKNEDVRMYVSRLLHATFCVQASGLPDEVVKKLQTSANKPISFRIFVDTNFLFSILELHENPLNETAGELLELIDSLNGTLKIDLFVIPRTIDEAKHSISLAKSQLSGFPEGINFSGAAMRVGLSGMNERFLQEKRKRNGNLSVNDWFNPYLDNFVSIARSKGVELFNEKLDSYVERSDVVDDIHIVREAEARRPRGKTYEMIQHDMILWHLVNDHRPAYIESPVDAKDWILTIDYRLIGFDKHKQKYSGSRVPICIHPTSLIQLLQFWMPRTKEFEEAILGSLRLPFLFQEFDAEGERTTLRILKGIGKFEGSDNLSESTIVDVVVNEGLRARINSEQNEDTEIKLIRDALVDIVKAQAEKHAQKAEQLEQAIQKRDATIATLTEAQLKTEQQAAKEREATAGQLAAQKEKINALQSFVEEQKEKDAQVTAHAARVRARLIYATWLLLVVVISGVITWELPLRISWLSDWIGLIPTYIMTLITAYTIGHFLLERRVCSQVQVQTFQLFLWARNARKWPWVVVVFSVLVGLLTNNVQEHMDRNKLINPTGSRPILKDSPQHVEKK